MTTGERSKGYGEDDIADLEAAGREIERLRHVCAQAIRFAAAVGAPDRVLDVLTAAATGTPLPHGGAFTPIAAGECRAIHELRNRLVRRIHEIYRDGDEIAPDNLVRAATEVGRFDSQLGAHLLQSATLKATVDEVMERVARFDRWKS